MGRDRVALGVAEPPEPGGFRECDDGLVWIRLPVPGALGHINVWLLPARDGWWLVDTGLAMEPVRMAWQQLEQRLPLGRIQGIVVTHHHPDHLGMAAELQARWQVPLRISAAARQAAERLLRPVSEAGRAIIKDWARASGMSLDAEVRAFMHGDAYHQIVRGVPASPDSLADGEVLALAARWQVSLHEGHAPGHACLHDEEGGRFISGDQLLPAISTNISLLPANREADPLGEYLLSLERLAALPEDTCILPAHGRPWHGPGARAAALRDGHRARLAELVELLDEPQTGNDLAEALFRMSRLDPINRLLAVGETLAHLRYLERRSLAVLREIAGQMHWMRA